MIHGIGMTIYNPYSQEMVTRVWGQPLKAENAGEFEKRTGVKLDNIHPDDKVGGEYLNYLHPIIYI